MTDHETTVNEVLDNWPYERLRTDDPQFREYLTIFTEELSDLNSDIETLNQNFYVETADGEELTKLGQRVQASDQGFVGDASETESIRYFIQLQLAVAASDGTARGFENVCRAAFGDDSLSEISVATSENTPELIINVPPNLLDEQPTTEEELIRALNAALPCGSGVQIVAGNDIFTFREDANNAKSYEAGFGDGTWSS